MFNWTVKYTSTISSNTYNSFISRVLYNPNLLQYSRLYDKQCNLPFPYQGHASVLLADFLSVWRVLAPQFHSSTLWPVLRHLPVHSTDPSGQVQNVSQAKHNFLDLNLIRILCNMLVILLFNLFAHLMATN